MPCTPRSIGGRRGESKQGGEGRTREMKRRKNQTEGNHAHPPPCCSCIRCLLVLNADSFFFRLSAPPEKDDEHNVALYSRQKPPIPSLSITRTIPSLRRSATASRHACRQTPSLHPLSSPPFPAPATTYLVFDLLASRILYFAARQEVRVLLVRGLPECRRLPQVRGQVAVGLGKS